MTESFENPFVSANTFIILMNLFKKKIDEDYL